MEISATVRNTYQYHSVVVATNDDSKAVQIASKASGYGSSVNGGELLLMALATCFCNDIYREAAKRNIAISEVEVVCTGEFGAEGEPGRNFRYKANVIADASVEDIEALINYTDGVAEIHNTLRQGLSVTLTN
ncbi:OsmC family protein [Spirosoma sp. BT702]|uniref:OsmC family protein n=1 Tax=Spirosoma profusum TaxID=2771354 RepID=A0A927AP42_9BACT|nr:OsmC family protein [Spirosoma profusum]MBD2703214.1 OsmC family protein [Spirosoma profusum]